MDFTQNYTFGNQLKIPEDTKVVWVSDLFVEDYIGGAELTSEAIIESSPLNVYKLHSKDVSMELLEQGQKYFWIFGNYSQLDLNIIPAIVLNMKYSVVEYDYKMCRFRSADKHLNETGTDCDCHETQHGKLIAAFYQGAKHLWWMSEGQMSFYHERFPLLKEDTKNTVLSSVFNDETLARIKVLREEGKSEEKKGWIVLGSKSWIKGYDDAIDYCEENDLEYEVLWDIPYEEVLKKMSKAKGHVYLPKGKDTCPRMVIEAKLLGCELVLNDNVQHKDEDWFNPVEDEDDDITQIEQYLYAARNWFWNGTKIDIDYQPTLSGYTTTRNCISQKYPFEACIKSMLDFCDEVVVMDGGSDDGTLELLEKWSLDEERLKVHKAELKWDSKRFAVFDGMLKGLAREQCSMDYCWQMDSDEIVHEDDFKSIKKIVSSFPSNVDILALPVVEYWGGKDKVRMDVNPWKWRVSRNRRNITHGVPGSLRVQEKDGTYFAKQGTDGCDYIDKNTLEPILFANFFTPDLEMLRRKGLEDEETRKQYEEWFNKAIVSLPAVYHFSWWDIERKIKTYKNYWQRHWESLFDIKMEDTSENNMFFDKRWNEVTDQDISEKAKELAEKTGGWVFHRKWTGQKTPFVNVSKELPKYIEDFIQ